MPYYPPSVTLPTTIAYEDEANTFAALQTIDIAGAAGHSVRVRSSTILAAGITSTPAASQGDRSVFLDFYDPNTGTVKGQIGYAGIVEDLGISALTVTTTLAINNTAVIANQFGVGLAAAPGGALDLVPSVRFGTTGSTDPTAFPVDTVTVFSKDFAAGDARLYVRSEASSTMITIGNGAIGGLSTPTLSDQAATKGYVDTAVTGLFDFKGSTDCSSNPNYPVGVVGDAYLVSVAGRIGGASGKQVDVGDLYIALANNAGGTEASVGTSWFVIEHNILALGTAAFVNTGTSGATVPLLNANNIHSGALDITGQVTVGNGVARAVITSGATDVTYSNAAGAGSNSAHSFSQPVTVAGRVTATQFASSGSIILTAFSFFVGVSAGTRFVFESGRVDQFRDHANPAVSPAQFTTNQDNFAAGNGVFHRWSSDASRNITGMTGGIDGVVREAWNVGAQNIVVVHDATSTAANRFSNVTGANLTIAAGMPALFRYDDTLDRWRTIVFNTAATYPTGTSGAAVPLLNTSNLWSGQQNFAIATLTSSASSVAWDLSAAQSAVHTLTEDTTLANPTNMVSGGTYVLRIVQHASSPKTMAWGSAFKWPGGSAPSISSTNGAIDVLTCVSDGTNMLASLQKGFA